MDTGANINKANFESLYKELQPRLYAYCRKFISDSETAKDLVQDAFMKLWEDMDASVIHTNTAAYITKMVHNLCLHHLRDRQINKRFEDYSAFLLKEAELNFFSPDHGGYTPIFLKDMEDIIQKCIDRLPPQSRRIFTMSRMEGMTYPEIAAELKISVRTVENQIYRALVIMKADLKDYMLMLILIRLFF
jgi:RNA polymerase sigma-70 factor (ECF subfamily)